MAKNRADYFKFFQAKIGFTFFSERIAHPSKLDGFHSNFQGFTSTFQK